MKATVLILGATIIAGSAGAVFADCPIPPALTACKACHQLVPGKPSKATGPNLVGVPGQPAMHSPDFKGYSAAMKAAQAKGLTWTDENLMAYIADPKAFFLAFLGEKMSNAMAYQVKDEAKRAAAVEGLKTISACQ